ncbi:hypothetical protein HanHA300_Chr17g0659141 [Helianthus annuus]|nr:hypothetical protein HanHA300_Chr17g0659141 [Helianthus annuus]
MPGTADIGSGLSITIEGTIDISELPSTPLPLSFICLSNSALRSARRSSNFNSSYFCSTDVSNILSTTLFSM